MPFRNPISIVGALVTAMTAFAFIGCGASAGSYGAEGIVVSRLDAPQIVLVGKWVEDGTGRSIGRVRSVDTNHEGKAAVVNIEVGAVRNRGTQIVAVDAHHIVYHPRNAKLVASLDPPAVHAPALPPNAPERASARRAAPPPPIFQD